MKKFLKIVTWIVFLVPSVQAQTIITIEKTDGCHENILVSTENTPYFSFEDLTLQLQDNTTIPFSDLNDVFLTIDGTNTSLPPVIHEVIHLCATTDFTQFPTSAVKALSEKVNEAYKTIFNESSSNDMIEKVVSELQDEMNAFQASMIFQPEKDANDLKDLLSMVQPLLEQSESKPTNERRQLHESMIASLHTLSNTSSNAKDIEEAYFDLHEAYMKYLEVQTLDMTEITTRNCSIVVNNNMIYIKADDYIERIIMTSVDGRSYSYSIKNESAIIKNSHISHGVIFLTIVFKTDILEKTIVIH